MRRAISAGLLEIFFGILFGISIGCMGTAAIIGRVHSPSRSPRMLRYGDAFVYSVTSPDQRSDALVIKKNGDVFFLAIKTGSGRVRQVGILDEHGNTRFALRFPLKAGDWPHAIYGVSAGEPRRQDQQIDVNFDGAFDVKKTASVRGSEEISNYVYWGGVWTPVDRFENDFRLAVSGNKTYVFHKDFGWLPK